MTVETMNAMAVDRRSLPRLALDMLRYRVAIMMWLFMLLGAAYHAIGSWPLDELVALTVALGASYVAATTVNDISDEEIDKVNHPAGRPLVHGEATPADLWRLNVVAAVAALAAGAYVGWRGIAVVVAALVIGYAYSVPPLLVSHRASLAAPVLTLAYVVAPYLHGLALADVSPGISDLTFAVGLSCLFLARIVLKDFRDREGDAAFGKSTVLLRFGKDVTCAASAAGLVVGVVLLAVALGSPWMAVIVAAFGFGIAAQLWALQRVDDPRREQVAIGVGARIGNGLLICVLGWLLLVGQSAPAAVTHGFTGLLTALYAATYVVLVKNPDDVLIGYKG